MDFEKINKILKKESKLIEIKKVHPVRNDISNGARKVIFVGDTHGDLEASQKVVKDYLKPGNKIIFLGDYVDRGPFSKENLDFLLETKLRNPNQTYLLQGNHEGYPGLKFSPAEFWEGLEENNFELYASIVEKFPLAADIENITALHGSLPDIKSLDEINQIKLGDDKWLQICWGDFIEKEGKFLGFNPLIGRPEFGKDWFFEKMERFRKNILIRSHQPDCPQFMFDNRCLTIFTSSAYTQERTIAIANLKKEIKDAKDLEIRRI